MKGMFRRSSKDNLKASDNVDHLRLAIQHYENRIRTLSQEKEELTGSVARLERVILNERIQSAIRISKLEQDLAEAGASRRAEISNSPRSFPEAQSPYPRAAEGARLSSPVLVDLSSLEGGGAGDGSPTASNRDDLNLANLAKLETAEARCRELEGDVAALRGQLDDERRRGADEKAEARDEVARVGALLAEKNTVIDAALVQIEALTGQVRQTEATSQQLLGEAQQRLATELLQRREEGEAHEQRACTLLSQVEELQRQADQRRRQLDELRLRGNQQRSGLDAATREAQRLRRELDERTEQMEYYQQRLVQTAAFRLVKTPFEAAADADADADTDAVALIAAAD